MTVSSCVLIVLSYLLTASLSAMIVVGIALLSLLLLRWAQASAPSTSSILVLAFVAGLAPLVRPEMALLGAGALLMVLLATGMSPRLRVAVIVVAGAVVLAVAREGELARLLGFTWDLRRAAPDRQ